MHFYSLLVMLGGHTGLNSTHAKSCRLNLYGQTGSTFLLPITCQNAFVCTVAHSNMGGPKQLTRVKGIMYTAWQKFLGTERTLGHTSVILRESPCGDPRIC
jgi:hypothetical protein